MSSILITMTISTDELWEALKEVAGATPDKSKIKRLVQVRRKHVDDALKLLRRDGRSA